MRRLQRCWQMVFITVAAAAFIAPTARADQPVDPTGTWKWERTFQDNTIQFSLRLKQKGDKITGKMSTTRRETEIENVQLEGEQLSFQVHRQGDRPWTASFRGKVSEDAITGSADVEFNGQAREWEWVAKRAVELADVVGTWNIRMESPDGNVRERVLEFSKEGEGLKGKYSGGSSEREAQDIELKENQLTFVLSGERDGNTWSVKYHARPRGNSMAGTIDFDFGGTTGTVDFSGKRAPEKDDDVSSE